MEYMDKSQFSPRKTLHALATIFPYRTCQRTYLHENDKKEIETFQYMYNFLNTYYRFGSYIPMTGMLDAATQHAVKTFQRATGIKVDGLIGCKTWDTAKSLTAKLHMYYICKISKEQLYQLPLYMDP